eukprot:jgi/Tetstr1/453834/TSEL_003998.t1
MKVLIIIPWPFAPKHIDIYVEETLKAIARTQSAEDALIVQDVYEGNVRNYLAQHYFRDEGKDGQIVSSVQRNKVVSLPLAGTAASQKLHGLVGVLKQQQKRVCGIIKLNTNAVKNLAATQYEPSPTTTSTRAVARSPRP